MYLSGIIWYIGDMVTNGHINAVGFWQNCKLWVIWVRAFFVCSYAAAILMRAYTIDLIFAQGKKDRGLPFYIPMAALFTIIFVICTSAHAAGGESPVHFISRVQMCSISLYFLYIGMAFVWISLTACRFIIWRLREIYSLFSEIGEFLIILFLGISNILHTALFTRLVPYYPLNIGYRAMSAIIDTCITNISVWIILFTPVFRSIFYRRVYLEDWLLQLESDRIASVYKKVDEYSESVSVRFSHQDDTADEKELPAQPGELELGGQLNIQSDLPSRCTERGTPSHPIKFHAITSRLPQ
ncbi:hypothetical protein DL89DRAFT_96903 [Linderina pennispora]|uniref:G-protein coupled receptors family 1 profile domain-containing protein n=1 Tax=Linderina pennispora TaxID=61395 RepID=A0A1Y1VWP9_9FUNG|nr:uncharacterized protein DL89DRAFT_96903 [Linderina pennispora]ORX65728.1 hypothetical protein DL89DRAFT_96903 [Linderina pennispora]